jgi:hypothetical protein
MCQPVTLTTASGNLAADSNNVYWTSGSKVSACPKTGGCGTGSVIYTADPAPPNCPQPSLLGLYGLSSPSPTSAYANSLYTLAFYLCGSENGTDLAAVTKNPPGGMQNFVNIVQPLGVVFDSTYSWVYALDQGGVPTSLGGANGVVRMKPDGTQFSLFAGGLGPAQLASLIVDSQNLYVTDAVDNRVAYCSLSGSSCTPTTAMTVSYPLGMYSDGTYLWVTAHDGTVSRCNVNSNCGASPKVISAAQKNPNAIVADANYAYWANTGSGQIMRCAVGGCGATPTPLVTVTNPYAMAIDEQAIYWADSGGIKKLAK